MDKHRIKVKIGDAEFDAEGEPDAVQSQYKAFLDLLAHLPKAAGKPTLLPEMPPPPPSSGQALTALLNPNGGLPATLMDRVFRQADNLSLAALPRGDNAEGDAMLALLYGYLKLSNQQTVTGTLLMRSAKISGVNIPRVDRVMDRMADLVLAAGVKKARRYQLNNRGIARAEEIIKAIMQ